MFVLGIRGLLKGEVLLFYLRMRRQGAYYLLEIVLLISPGSFVSMLYYCNSFERSCFSVKRDGKLGPCRPNETGDLLLWRIVNHHIHLYCWVYNKL